MDISEKIFNYFINLLISISFIHLLNGAHSCFEGVYIFFCLASKIFETTLHIRGVIIIIIIIIIIMHALKKKCMLLNVLFGRADISRS